MSSPYILMPMPQSFCQKCHQKVSLLCGETHSLPSFFICWNCKSVAEVGVGPVELRQGEPTLHDIISVQNEQEVQAQVEEGMMETVNKVLDAGRTVLTKHVVERLFKDQENGKTALENLMSGYGHHPKTVQKEIWNMVHEAIGPVGPFAPQAP